MYEAKGKRGMMTIRLIREVVCTLHLLMLLSILPAIYNRDTIASNLSLYFCQGALEIHNAQRIVNIRAQMSNTKERSQNGERRKEREKERKKVQGENATAVEIPQRHQFSHFISHFC